ncbi:hypothetical protein NEOLI_004358 [Neolecta irregularis DAH-3]|uniref:Uncharacterized protein n=1 Tax=Neolecta irregularis (strain DAH-3) TaxID=1198029 RepID=A0A1U7LME6_NEOID|nr:hypothetical protein NEOLI_004358 [Neolecta irregularis DAH-3]|eukprot:OLL23840.1 hypothetical protein NEOLI_004358 [Neolecta irregularis DAH-3]
MNFLMAITKTHSYRKRNPHLKSLVLRTAAGSLAMLTTEMSNLTYIATLKETNPAWKFLACCSVDVAATAVVLHCLSSQASYG